LKQSRLPLLRWPGGNFVSAYHWEDGIGPSDARPTKPNYAWGGVETNLFGTDEFMDFCGAVGCEPMICVNAGSGTPEEAARWVQYCNGSVDSPMGQRRAAAGHSAPYNVRRWEIGNELWGRWQCGWTTATGYVDRYQRFRKAMLAADPTIRLYACGAPMMDGSQWNHTLIRGAAPLLTAITDHPLIGGSVPLKTDPMDVFRDFMAVPDVLAAKWSRLQQDMAAAGIAQPRLAVTELQMFAHLGPAEGNAPVRLTRENLVSPSTQAEALYDILIYHRAIRLAPLVEMATHSATVNHGGGLRKERERVYANPCHWAQAGFAAFASTRPVKIEVTSPEETAPLVLPAMADHSVLRRYAAIDAMAAVADDETLWLSIIHRGTSEPIHVAVEFGPFHAAAKADLYLLSADVPWAANTLRSPETVKPQESTIEIHDGKLILDLKPFTWCRVRLPKSGQ
jgi:alpha-N-arabinofuranosidase